MTTKFYINGRWVELEELKEKAEKWDELTKTPPSKSLLEKTNDCRVAESKLEAITHHFKTHECMYRFDFNMLMDEASSEFTTDYDKEIQK